VKRDRENSGERSGSRLIAATNALKSHVPALHGLLKRTFHWSRLPALKLLNGKLAFAAPNLFGVSPPEPHIFRWIDESLRPGDTFFDVGAHHGWMSLVACRCVGAKGRVVAFEPSPPLLHLLQYNKQVNRFHQMEIVPKAVADSHGCVESFFLENDGFSSLNSMIDHREELTAGPAERKATIQVETTTLDEFCKMTNLQPKAVKIDVEGAELRVLRGGQCLLKERRTTFIVAVHPTWLPEGQSATQIFDLFHFHGYRVAEQKVWEGGDFGDYLFVPDPV
jgi:FkbM family methyltransferase